jgi:hypothetical protein
MNAKGYMHGSQITSLGKKIDAKHKADMRKKKR